MRIGDFDVSVRRTPREPLFAENEVMITLAGKEAEEEGRFSDSRGRVLSVLSGGKSTINELSNDTRMSIDKVKNAVNDLIRKGLVLKAGVESERGIERSQDSGQFWQH